MSKQDANVSEKKKKTQLCLIYLRPGADRVSVSFPEIEEAYQKYQDKIEILAVSNDTADTMEDIVTYKKEHGLTFPMG